MLGVMSIFDYLNCVYAYNILFEVSLISIEQIHCSNYLIKFNCNIYWSVAFMWDKFISEDNISKVKRVYLAKIITILLVLALSPLAGLH